MFNLCFVWGGNGMSSQIYFWHCHHTTHCLTFGRVLCFVIWNDLDWRWFVSVCLRCARYVFSCRRWVGASRKTKMTVWVLMRSHTNAKWVYEEDVLLGVATQRRFLCWCATLVLKNLSSWLGLTDSGKWLLVLLWQNALQLSRKVWLSVVLLGHGAS